MEAAMQSIIKTNIARFKLLLSTEADPTQRAMEIRLLAGGGKASEDAEA
jgi:hypothetical protein